MNMSYWAKKVKSTWVSGQALLPSGKQRHSKIVPQPQVTWYNDHLIGWWEDFYSQNHLTRPNGLGIKGSYAFTWETSKPKGPYHQSHDDQPKETRCRCTTVIIIMSFVSCCRLSQAANGIIRQDCRKANKTWFTVGRLWPYDPDQIQKIP